MARPALATVPQLEVAIGEPVDDHDQAEYLLRRASAGVRAYAGATWLNDDGELDDVPDDVADVVVAMVERATRNADGIVSEQNGPFSRSFGADAAQRLYLTAMDKLVLDAAVGATGITTVSTTRGPLETRRVAGVGPLYPEEERIPWP